MFSSMGGPSGSHRSQHSHQQHASQSFFGQQQQQQQHQQQPASVYAPPPLPPQGPIKLQGFEIPTASSSSTSSGRTNAQASPSTSQGAFSVDPSMLFGFEHHSSTTRAGGDRHGASPSASSASHKTVSPPPFLTSGTAAFSDLDLDFETTLASLAQHHQQHQQQQQQHAHAHAQHLHHHPAAAHPAFGSGLYRLNADHHTASPAHHSPHLANHSHLGHYSGPESSYGAYDAHPFGGGGGGGGGMPTYLTSAGDTPPPPPPPHTVSASSTTHHPTTRVPISTSPLMSHSLSNPQAPSPRESRHHVRSPATPTTPLLDLFGNPLSPTNPDSPHAVASHLHHHHHQQQQQQQQRRSSQVAQEFGSYSSSHGEGFGPSSAVPITQAIPLKASSSKRRGSAVVVMPGSPEAAKSLSSSHGRSRSTGVGKAPTSRARSRSARRNGGAAYSTNGSANAASNNLITSTHPPSSTSGPTAAIAIPVVKGGDDGVSSSVPKNNNLHQLAMSMPAYPGGGSSDGTNRHDWFTSSQAIRGAGGSSYKSGNEGASLGTSASTTTTTTMDAESGWRPSAGSVGVPSSAPVLGSSKKGKMTLDDVPEDPTQRQAALLTEKRRKRRESHNAVERRRRDNINDRITELASLLPEVLLDQVNSASSAAAAKAAASGVSVDDLDEPVDGSFAALSLLSPDPSTGFGLSNAILGTSPTSSAMLGTSRQMTQGAGAAAAATMGKPNKGIILQKSVEYIRYLQQLLELHLQRGAALEHRVSELEAGRFGGLDGFDGAIDGIRSKGSRSAATTTTSSGGIRSPSLSNASEALFDFSPTSTTGAVATTTTGDGQGWIIPKEEEMDQS